ncbi:MAG: primosome assembly protein PriA [Actinomycetia bacterium]|nr:primosome assembly protein PriA [Actinomycetes bacterium]
MSVAAVLVDTGLAHLDRPFEYSIPEDLAEAVSPGVRVKVRFAGRDLDGYVLEVRDEAEHPGRLQPLRRVVSPESVLRPSVLAAAEQIARSYAGLTGDVLRLAVPPRHARAEKALPLQAPASGADLTAGPTGEWVDDAAAWVRYPAGPALLRRIRAGESPWAAWSAVPAGDPAQDWPAAFADAAAAAVGSGRGAILLAPDHRDVARLAAAVTERLGAGACVLLTADQGPQARYTAFLKVLRGHARIAIGTRAAAWAPVHNLGLIAWWDDGDDLWEEPRAPYAQLRDIVRARAQIEECALLAGGFGRSVAVQGWIEGDVVKDVVAAREVVRAAAPRVLIASDEHERDLDPVIARARIPGLAWRTAKAALEHGPVLVQVPRRGYVPSLACQHCRRRAQCRHCGGTLGLTDRDGTLICRLCQEREGAFRCPTCNGRSVRALVIGARRTAEEIGRAFPGVPVHTSGAGSVLSSVAAAPAIVIATPGAEPVAEGGYTAVLLLDAWAMLDRPSIDAGVEALRRWMGAAALARGADDGGAAVLCGVPPHGPVAAVEALSRWDAPWLAARELAERRELALPPAAVMAVVTGERRAVADVADGELPEGVLALGPVIAPDGSARLVLRVHGDEAGTAPGADAVLPDALADYLAAVRRTALAKKADEVVSIRMRVPDPTL